MLIKIQIGDYSRDGHGMFEDFYYEVNRTVQQIRDAYHRSCEKYPELDNFCKEYDDHCVSEEQIKQLKDLGYDVESKFDDEGRYPGPEGCADFSLWFAGLSMKGFEYKRTSEDVPTLNHYGFIKGKHLKLPGYGCFSL